jgi:hypothetical protein
LAHLALPPEAITAAVDELTRDRSAMWLLTANREVHRVLTDWIAVSVVDPESPPSSPALLSQREKGAQPVPLPLGGAIGSIEGRDDRQRRRRPRMAEAYPPDLQEEAVKTVLAQAELLCAEWV